MGGHPVSAARTSLVYVISQCCLCALGVSAGPAFSQTLDEIVVTASKRGAEPVQDAPYNISAITGDALSQLNARSVEDISRAVPGLSTWKLAASNSQIVIRGLVSEEETDSLTSIYVDDVPVPTRAGFNVRAPNLGLYDLERIEVLRGPQGTLYGAEAQGGTLRYITEKPNTDQMEGYLETTIGSRSSDAGSQFNVNGAINIPLIRDKFAIRAMAAYQDTDGRIDRPSLNLTNTDDAQNSVLRISALLELTESTSLSAVYFRQSLEQSDSSLVTATSDAVPLSVLEPFEDELTYFSVTINHEFGLGSLTATLSEFERDNFYSFDVSRFFAPMFARVNQPFVAEITSAEVRYSTNLSGRVQYIAGLYYEDSDSDLATDRGFGTFIEGTTGQPIPNSPLFFDRSNERKTTSKALFGETTIDVNEKLSILVGARFFEVQKDRVEEIRISPFAPPGIYMFPASNENDSVFKLNVSYDASDDTICYFTFSEGFRGGGANDANLAGAFGSTIPNTYESDLVTNFEFGSKTILWNQQAKLNAALYYMNWDNIQTFLDDATGAFGFVVNAGAAEMMGVEVEGEIQPQSMAGFSLAANFRYSNQELSEDAPINPGNPFSGLKGDHIPNTFEFELGIRAEQSFRVGHLDGFVNLNASYQSEADTTFRPEDPTSRQWGDFWLMGVNVGLQAEKWSAVLYSRNLFNEREPLSWAVEPLETLVDRVIITTPREIGLKLRYEF